MNVISRLKKAYTACFLILILQDASSVLSGQADGFRYFYRVIFMDKGDNIPAGFPVSGLLSERAVKRREKAGIPYPDIKDVPVFSGYLEKISSLGLTLHCTSKWMNSGLFKSREAFDTDKILVFPFVREVKIVKSPPGKGEHINKYTNEIEAALLSDFDRPVTMINGTPLQASGFDGSGVLIAVLDAGFDMADQISSLYQLRNRKGIKSTYNFVNRNENVYGYHYHGTAVLSVLAGTIAGYIQGTGPGADFLLIRTEDPDSEFPVEEDFWAAGAEYADSAGADIISSSLGYAYFDNPLMNYTFQSMDGKTAFVTRAAGVAASKGIVVVASAGNERTNPWKRIIAPSDGDSVICVGAVDASEKISSFSSAGPSADGRVKPDVVAMGVSVPVQVEQNKVTMMNGTSFSCPVLSGLTACLMQAVPEAVIGEIISAIHLSADRYLSPDSLYGYGVPDMLKTLRILQDIHLMKPDDPFIAGPNPTTGNIEITFREPPEKLTIEVFTSSGVTVFRREIKEYAGRKLNFDIPGNRPQGLYILRMTTGTGTYTRKIIKTNDR